MLLLLILRMRKLRRKSHSKCLRWDLNPGLQISGFLVVTLLLADWPLCMSHKYTGLLGKVGSVS